ncbi:MAG: hypothetical protein IJU68_02700 [Bacteroidales bacterium]|nr:hypothetical protein [Bacteroidales bacterium]
MMKSLFKYIPALPLLVLLFSCTEKIGISIDVPRTKTIHYSATIDGGSTTRASLGEDMKYSFERGDRVYMESEGGELYGFLSLSRAADIGRSEALFEGELTCAEDFTPVASTPVSLVLVGPDDAVHTITDGKVGGTDYADKKADSLQEAVRRLSHFTGSGKFGDLRYTLSQQSSFMVMSFMFDEQITPSGTALTATILNTQENTRIGSYSFNAEEVDGDVESTFVAAFPSGIVLEDARVVLAQEGQEDLVLKMADQTLKANNYYTFQRTTFMQDYFAVEAISAGTKVTFSKGSGNGIQYSLDGYDWANYSSAVTLPNAGDVIYFRGKGTNYQITGNSSLVSADKNSYVYGDIMFLMCDDKYKAKSEITASYAFQRAFYNAKWLKLHPEKKLRLSASTMSRGCYMEMFYGCTNITGLENLALNNDAALTAQCFESMFFGTGITAIPSGFLPRTDLALACYSKMFEGCKSLTGVPADLLPSTTLANGCYLRMFAECSVLERGPDLMAVDPQPGCYFAIFRKCSKLNYVRCRLKLTSDQCVITRPDTSYSDSASPASSNVENWTVINLWTVFNKWLDGVQNNNKCNFYANPAMLYLYPFHGGTSGMIGSIPNNWNVYYN